MRTLLLASLLCASCATTNIGGDLRAVRAEARAPAPDVTDEVELETPKEARAILAKPLDADDAVRVALLSNRDLRATLREMGVARGQLAQAGALPNPIGSIEILPERNSQIELRVEYAVTGLLFAALRANALAPALDAARLRAAARVVEIGAITRARFHALSAAEKKLALANQALEALAVSRDAADALFRAGNIKELDLATHDAAYQEARADVAELELQRATAREALVRALGAQGAYANVVIVSALPDPPQSLALPDALETRATSASLDLRARKAELEYAARAAGVSRFEGFIPDVSADVHILQARDAATGEAGGNWSLGGGARASIPLLDQKRGQTAALEARYGADLERYVGAAIDVRSRVRALAARLTATHARARQYADVIIPARRRVLEQALLQYDAMQLSVFQLLDARRAELQSELNAVDATREWAVAQAMFDAAMAGAIVEEGK